MTTSAPFSSDLPLQERAPALRRTPFCIIDDFAGAVFGPDGHRADQPLVAIVFVFQMRAFRVHKFHHESENNPRGGEAAEHGESEYHYADEARILARM